MIDNISNAINQRLRNPWFTGFLLAFIVLNWEAILILFYPEQDWTIRERLLYLRTEIYSDPNVRNSLFLWPLLAAAFWVFVMPWLSALADTAAHWAGVWKEQRAEAMNRRLPQHVKDFDRILAELQAEQKKVEMTYQDLHNVKNELVKANKTRDEALLEYLKMDPELHRQLRLLAKDGSLVELPSGSWGKMLVQFGLAVAHKNNLFELTELGRSILRQSRS